MQVEDVLYYYGDKVPNSTTPKNAHFSVGPGYDYEVINTEILLNNLTVKNGKLVLSNGAEFSMLTLEPEDVIHPAVLSKLSELANQGAEITGQKFTNTNIKNTNIPGNRIEPADQTRVPWADVPLIQSGLLGPVTIKSVKMVK